MFIICVCQLIKGGSLDPLFFCYDEESPVDPRELHKFNLQ